MDYQGRVILNSQKKLKLIVFSASIGFGALLHCLVHGLSKEDKDELMDLMTQQLSALMPEDQNSFVELCITKGEECSEEQFTGGEAIFSWRSGITPEIQDRFWKTYQCVLLEDPNQCPVDGDWTEWSPWSKCEAPCGDSGWQVRHRVCENPRPANGGEHCDGIRTKNRSCIGLCAKNSNGQGEAVEYIKHMHTAFPELQGLCVEKHCIYEEALETIKDPRKVDRYWSSINCVKYGGACPVNGGWGEWGAWSECSVKCGHGEVYRKRECDQPTTKNGGIFCQGLWYQKQQCLATECEEDETFTEWSPFSPCSESCGKYGVKTTVRSCLSEKPCLVRGRKMNEIAKTVPCFGGECPQNGGWSKWGSWTSCSAECGTGRRTRIRKCDQPYPYGGEECLGPSIQATTCDGNFCIQMPDLDQPLSETSRHERFVNNDNDDCLSSLLNSSFWSGWNLKQEEITNWTLPQKLESNVKTFSVSGITNLQKLSQNINTSFVNYKKHTDDEKRVNSNTKTESRISYPDNKINVSVSFFDGKSADVQEKNISDPHKRFGRRASTSDKSTLRMEPEISDDDPYMMPLNPDLEYAYTGWSRWTPCTKTCGGGIRHRKRTCKNKEIVCRGEVKPEQFCNMNPCPVPGSWSQWQGWSPCSVTCGMGVAERYRACDNPLPSFGGSCTGLNSQSQPCSMPRCVIKLSGKGSWGSWSLWTDCSATCGGGIRSRQKFRMLQIQRRSESSMCNIFPCPEKGMWAAWGGWSTCSRDCGLGETYRDRTCTDPAPVYGGDPCVGPGSEVETCYGGPCLDEDDYGVLLRGKGYLKYPERGKTTGFLMVFMRLKPLQLSGVLFHHYRKCHRDLIDCDCSILLTLNSGQVRLSSRSGRENSPIILEHPSHLVLNKWQDVIIVTTTTWAEIRVNDGARVVKNFPTTLEHSNNFDGTLIVGANRIKQNGFHGEIAALRKNFKVLLLYNIKAWSGYGLPLESVGTKKVQLSNIVRHPDFKGKYYSHIFFRQTKYFHATATFQLTGSNGLLLFNGGTNASFLSVVILHGTLQFCLSCDGKSICRKAYELKTGEWYMLNVAAKGNEGQIRLNDGDAMQIMCSVGEVYQPRGSLYVSGARSKDWTVIVAVTKNQIMFFGVIDTLVVNGLPITYKMATLLDVEGGVNSLGYSVSDHVTEVFEHKKTLTTLRCGVPQNTKRNHIVKIIWLQDMTRLKAGDGTDIIDADTESQTVSEVNLHSSHHGEGVYACLLSKDGSLVVLQVFILLRFAGGEMQDEESYGEWVAFIVLLLFILLCLCPCLLYYCTKDHDIWKSLRKMLKREKEEEEETLMNESTESAESEAGFVRGTQIISGGPTGDDFVQSGEATTDRESQSEILVATDQIMQTDSPLGVNEMIKSFAFTEDRETQSISPDEISFVDEMNQMPDSTSKIGPLTAPFGNSYAQQITIKMPPVRQYQCYSQSRISNPLITPGPSLPSIPRYNPYPCYDPCNPCKIPYTPCNVRCDPCNPSSVRYNPCDPCNPSSVRYNPCDPCNPCSVRYNPCNPCDPCNTRYNPCHSCSPCDPCSPMGAGAIRPVDLLRNPYFVNGMIYQGKKQNQSTNSNLNTNNPVLYNPSNSAVQFLAMPTLTSADSHYTQDQVALDSNNSQLTRGNTEEIQEKHIKQCIFSWPNTETLDLYLHSEPQPERDHRIFLEGSRMVTSECDTSDNNIKTEISELRNKENLFSWQGNTLDNFSDSLVTKGEKTKAWQVVRDNCLTKDEPIYKQGNQLAVSSVRQESPKEQQIFFQDFSSDHERNTSTSLNIQAKSHPCPVASSTSFFKNLDSFQHVVGETNCTAENKNLLSYSRQSTAALFEIKKCDAGSTIVESNSSRNKHAKLVKGRHWRTKSHSQIPSPSAESQRVLVQFHAHPRPTKSKAENDTDDSPPE